MTADTDREARLERLPTPDELCGGEVQFDHIPFEDEVWDMTAAIDRLKAKLEGEDG